MSGKFVSKILKSCVRSGASSARVKTVGRFKWGLCAMAFSLMTMQSALASVNVSQVPPFLTESVDPNLIFVLDDSGSMNREYMPDNLGNDRDENWWYSHVVNTVYYNPAVDYEPPLLPDGSGRYPDADYTSAWRDGYDQSGGPDNLSNFLPFDAIGSIEEAFYMEFSGTPGCQANPRDNDCYTEVFLNDLTEEDRQNYANWYSYYRTRIHATRAGITQAFFDLPESVRLAYGDLRESNNNIDGQTTDTLESGVRNFTSSHRETFLNWLHTGEGISGGTPLRTALQGVGEYLERTDDGGPWSDDPANQQSSPHIECRQNFTILMTDGIWNGGDPNSIDNEDNTDGPGHFNHKTGETEFTYEAVSPFADDHDATLADVAMHYWKRDLRPDLDNLVPTNENDPAYWQHMATFTVGLGVTGTIEPSAAFAAIESGDPINWPEPAPNRGAENVDDLLHAGVNGRGGFFSAQNPQQFADAIASFLKTIVARAETSASAATVNSSILQTDSLGFFAGFRSDDWSGTLEAFNLKTGDLVWDAEQNLADNDVQANLARKFFTYSDGDAVALDDPLDLSAAHRQALNANPAIPGEVDNRAVDRIEWLSGLSLQGFRSRKGPSGEKRLLGDIVNSNPQFAGKFDFGFNILPSPEGQSYVAFRNTTTYRNRTDALYVAANDGFLHAFDSENGEELFAYMPSSLLEPEEGTNEAHARISELMQPDYSHRYLMDGTPTVSDAYVDLGGAGGKAWHTLLVGTMGLGGETVFALDVTNPSSFAEDDVLWEFEHPELGVGVTSPKIVRLESGQWVAVFANGYNSDSEESGLFVVDLENGNLVKFLPTGAGGSGSSNGLATPVVTSFPESDGIGRFAYAGDLLGNLWRFDLTGNPNSWDVTKVFEATDPSGNPQPITAQPRVALNPDGSRPGTVIVAFGTGSFFRTGDLNDDQVQSLYGIIDDTSGPSQPIERSDLLEQEIESQQVVADFGGLNVGRLSDNQFDTNNPEEGWVLDLDIEAGERVTSTASFPFGTNPDRIQFATFVPNEDPCRSSRKGFIMDVQLSTGGQTETSPLDFNNDGEINSADLSDDEVQNRYQAGDGTQVTTVYDPDDGTAKRLDNEAKGQSLDETLKQKPSGMPDSGRIIWERLR